MKTTLLFFALFLFSNILYSQTPRPFPAGLPTCLEDDFRQLEKLYDTTDGEKWKNNSGWFSANMKSWYGIYLTDNNCDVEFIVLDNNNLKGKLPSLDLPNLTGYFVRYNNLSDTIPNFDKLPKLEKFSCNYNQLTGTVPNFDKLPNLIEFGCTNNQLTGNIPNFEKLIKLQKIEFTENQLSGTIPNFKLPALYSLACYKNNLTGSIPNFDQLPNLEDFYCRDNQLTGTIPNFNKLTKLSIIDCSKNQLTGNIPNFDNLPNLREFYCGKNQLTDTIPNFDKLSNLNNIDCSNNMLTGTIPSFDKLSGLYIFNCSNNQLSGSIPNFNTPKLFEFYCYNNQLTGNIPEFSKALTLDKLNCNNNLLNGNLPNNTFSLLFVSNNYFNFGNLESAKASNFEYYSQKTRLPITKKDNQIIADLAGTSLNKLTYDWYLDDKLIKTTKNINSININKRGRYSYRVSHATLTKSLLIGNSINIGGLVNGKIFYDKNNNCTFENGENKLEDVLIRFENSNDTITTLVDTNGFFKVALDTFNYKIFINAGSNWKACTLPNVKFKLGSDSLFINIPMQTIVATSDPSQANWKVSVWPNPAKQQVIFDIENSQNQFFTLKITDSYGRVLHSQESDKTRFLFNNNLPEGVYFYHIESENKFVSGKLMVVF